MVELTKAQWRELRHAATCSGGTNNLKYFIGESLRKKGYLERYTTYLTGADFADRDGVHCQFRGSHTRHEWWITNAGRAALSEQKGERG